MAYFCRTGVKFEQCNMNIFCLTNIRLPLKHITSMKHK